MLTAEVKAHLREQRRALPHARPLFVRRRTAACGRPARVTSRARSRRGRSCRGLELERYDDLLELDLAAPGAPVEHPLFLVCTHGKHDRCCAVLRPAAVRRAARAASTRVGLAVVPCRRRPLRRQPRGACPRASTTAGSSRRRRCGGRGGAGRAGAPGALPRPLVPPVPRPGGRARGARGRPGCWRRRRERPLVAQTARAGSWRFRRRGRTEVDVAREEGEPRT